MRFLEVVVALAIKESEQRRPKPTSRKRRKIYSRTHMYLFMKASRVVLRGVWFGLALGRMSHNENFINRLVGVT